MSIDTWLAIVGLLIGVLGIILAYVFYKKALRTKVLGIAYTPPIPILMTLEDVHVSYKGKPVKALSRVYVLLWNRGTAPIESADFLAPIEFKYGQLLIKLEISDKDAAARVNLDPENGTLDIQLLRPGEAILIQSEVASDAFTPDINIQMKSSDMSTFIGAYQSIYPALVGVVVSLAVLAIQSFLLYRLLPPPIPDWETKMPDNFLVFIAILLVGAAVYMIPPIGLGTVAEKLVKKFLERSTNRVAWRFSQIKFAAVGMEQRSRAFRKFMAGVTNR